MPAIRTVTLDSTKIAFADSLGPTKTLAVSAIPSIHNTSTLAEVWINSAWVATNVAGYQMQVHLFSLSPFSCNVWFGNLGVPIPANWWL